RHVWINVKIGSEDGSKIIETKALVDTGATLTVIPREIARELGLRATGRSRVETGAGVIEMERSRAYIEIMGKKEIIPVLISDIIDKVLIGVTTLEILGLEIDPATGTLREKAILHYLLE
ncbi:MAG: clan AA aspartic protease, partial [Desulfurococcaceae archaeon]|nr:clan AA aspartic protease [Desulfurococcaceae archaeon]